MKVLKTEITKTGHTLELYISNGFFKMNVIASDGEISTPTITTSPITAYSGWRDFGGSPCLNPSELSDEMDDWYEELM